MYSFDIEKFIHRLLPPFLRTALQKAWIRVLLKPVEYLLTQLQAYRVEKLNELSYNGQTIQLERYLNDIFDSVQRRIQVKHYADSPDFDYLLSENGSALDYDYLISESTNTGFLYFIGENSAPLGVDFIVLFPSSISTLSEAIKARVDKYRVAGKQYQINYI